MDLTIGAKSVKVEKGNFFKDLSVELEDVDGDTVLEDLKENGVSSAQAVNAYGSAEILGAIDISTIVDHFGPGKLLDEIGEDETKKYFDLVERGE